MLTVIDCHRGTDITASNAQTARSLQTGQRHGKHDQQENCALYDCHIAEPNQTRIVRQANETRNQQKRSDQLVSSTLMHERQDR